MKMDDAIKKAKRLSASRATMKHIAKNKEKDKEYRERRKEMAKDWRNRNAESVKITNMNRATQQLIIKNTAKEAGCSVCGLVDPDLFIFDLHHVNPIDKKYNLNHNVAPSVLVEEIKKCIVVCANCHRKIHLGRGSSLDNNATYWELDRDSWTLGFGNYGTTYKMVPQIARPYGMPLLQGGTYNPLPNGNGSIEVSVAEPA